MQIYNIILTQKFMAVHFHIPDSTIIVLASAYGLISEQVSVQSKLSDKKSWTDKFAEKKFRHHPWSK